MRAAILKLVIPQIAFLIALAGTGIVVSLHFHRPFAGTAMCSFAAGWSFMLFLFARQGWRKAQSLERGFKRAMKARWN